jgi:hypothetical protein
MTREVTGIALSVADQVRDWSRQERNLAITLRALHTSVLLPVPCDPVVREVVPLSLFGPQSDVPSDRSLERSPRERPNWPSLPADDISLPARPPGEMTVADPVRVEPKVAVETFEPLDYDIECVVSTDPAASDMPVVASGPFDAFIAAVSDSTATPPVPMAPLPPPSRFMVRVAQVAPPHRATKRNYDYFEELNIRLAAQSAAHPQSDPS